MKKILSMVLALLMLSSVFTLTACNGNEKESDTETETAEPEIIPETPFPVDRLRINGTDISEYVIVTNKSAGGVMTYAAEELRKYLELTCGATLEIVESADAGTLRILIDETRISDDSTFGVYSDADGLVLAGTSRRSALYAVYHFLEEFLGWRFFAADCEVCYETSAIDLKDIDYTKVLQMKIRDMYELEASDIYFAPKRYFNGSGRRKMDAEQYVYLGGTDSRDPNGIHTFDKLAETGGDGGSGGTQPCLNDPAVRETIRDNVREFLDTHPDAISIHVSQNDNDRYCTCDECSADLEYYSAPSGSIIELVNYLAEDLDTYKDGVHKDVLVITYAYQYSMVAPDNIICNDDVLVEMAIIDFCHQHTYHDESCASGVDFVRANTENLASMEKWKSICKNFYITDYGMDLKHFWIVYPNFDVLYDDMKYLMDLGSWGYTVLSNPYTKSAEFGALRTYVYAKLTEDPEMTREEYENHISEFIDAYYGEAAELIRKYFDLCHEISNNANICFGCFSAIDGVYGEGGAKAFEPYFDQLVEWFDTAETLVADDAATLEHVRRLRVSMDFLRIGAKYRDVKKTRDQELIQALYAETEAFYEECLELGLNRPTEYPYFLPDEPNGKTNPLSIG